MVSRSRASPAAATRTAGVRRPRRAARDAGAGSPPAGRLRRRRAPPTAPPPRRAPTRQSWWQHQSMVMSSAAVRSSTAARRTPSRHRSSHTFPDHTDPVVSHSPGVQAAAPQHGDRGGDRRRGRQMHPTVSSGESRTTSTGPGRTPTGSCRPGTLSPPAPGPRANSPAHRARGHRQPALRPLRHGAAHRRPPPPTRPNHQCRGGLGVGCAPGRSGQPRRTATAVTTHGGHPSVRTPPRSPRPVVARRPPTPLPRCRHRRGGSWSLTAAPVFVLAPPGSPPRARQHG